jgi:hypothetical protein
MQISEKFLVGYKQASEFSGIPARRIYRMVEARKIRAIKPNSRTVMFIPSRLMEDLMGMEVSKI